MEVLGVGGKERFVVEQTIDGGELFGKPETDLRQN